MIKEIYTITKGPPGPPPRPGLIWHEETSRWRKPEDVIDEGMAPTPQQGDQPEKKPTSIENVARMAEASYQEALTKIQNMFPDYEVSGRAKSADAIKGKLAREHQRGQTNFVAEKLHDLVGIRIHAPSIEEVYHTVNILRNAFPKSRERDYNRTPNNGYRSFHFLIDFNEIGTEIQIRVPEQTKLYEWSHDSLYKTSGNLPPEVLEVGNEYAAQMSEYYIGVRDILPDCPKLIAEWLGCVE